MEVEFFHKGFIGQSSLTTGTSWTRGVSDTGEIIKADTMSCMGSPLDTH